MNDIESRTDIDLLMRVFYQRALEDDVIGHIFDIAGLDLEKHLPVIGDFWETLLFTTGSYAKHGRNPLAIHKELDLRVPLKREHFERWLQIFRKSVDEEFEGVRADFIKSRAEAIAERMQQYIRQGSEPASTPADRAKVRVESATAAPSEEPNAWR
jgi:hemoglobin